MKAIDWILAIASIALAAYGLWRAQAAKRALTRLDVMSDADTDDKTRAKLASGRKWGFILAIVGGWLFLSLLLTAAFGNERETLDVSLFSNTVFSLHGIPVSESVLGSWIVIAIVLVFGLFFRFYFVPRFQDKPTGLQNVMELIVDTVKNYTGTTSDVLSSALVSYIMAIGLLMVGAAVLELFGFRAPTSDLFMTGSMALVTLVFINYYGIKKKGLMGRVKSLAEPTPIIFPFELISMIATPISMACRLFGNMLGGMIVIDLLYYALGTYSVGLPAVFGLYFNVFHPLIQAYIFITLTLTFIREAVESR